MGGKRLAFVAIAAVLGHVACAAKPRPIAQHAAAGAVPHEEPRAGSEGAEPGEPAEDEAAEEGTPEDEQASTASPDCPRNMVLVASNGKRFCIDKYEASLVEHVDDGERPYPHYLPVDGHEVRAVSEPGVFPQGYISEVQAQDACAASGKRLCSHVEWKTACRGPSSTTFPYGEARRPGVCHDMGKSPVAAVFGAAAVASSPAPAKPAAKTATKAGKPTSKAVRGRAAVVTKTRGGVKVAPPGTKPVTKKKRGAPARASAKPAGVDASVWTKLNDPKLGQVDGALAHTGDHGACVNDFGVFDMVGNLHEWVATDPAAVHGTFAGGYYLDTSLNGDGCEYRTVAHAHEYHDYSTGFRCCAEPSGSN